MPQPASHPGRVCLPPRRPLDKPLIFRYNGNKGVPYSTRNGGTGACLKTKSKELRTPDRRGVVNELARLLHQYGLQNVQTCVYTLEYRAGTPEGHFYYEDVKHASRTFVPFLRKWTRVPDDYEAICQQALNEMQQPDFVATCGLLTAWGTVPFARLHT